MQQLRKIMTSDGTRPERGWNARGFTLVEMAISIIIVGLIVAALSQAYTIYQRKEKIRVTDDNVKAAVTELQKFKQQNGFFPCPAPLTAPRTDSSYGQSPAGCATAALANGTPAAGATGINGLAVATSTRLVTPSTGPAYNPVILTGALPFRSLNMDEKATYDGYGSKLLYVVTQRMTSLTTFNDKEGGITIVAPDGTQMTSPDNAGIFALFSPGRNRIGGYDKNGNLAVPCAGGLDTENCDNDSTFMTAQQSDSAAVNFDDKVDFFSELSDTLWVRTSSGSKNIKSIPRTGVGLGTSSPVVMLDIRDASGPPGKPEGTLRASGRILAEKLCPDGSYGTNNTNCFEPRNIGGDNTVTPVGSPATAGNGMKCPPGTYMNGIQAGKPICAQASISCASPIQMMIGINPATGMPICTIRPCNTETRTVCGAPKTLDGAPVGTYKNLTGGDFRVEYYRCISSGSTVYWQNYANSPSSNPASGCSCAPSSTTTPPKACGPGWTGTYTETTTVSCPAGTSTTTSTKGSDCVCGPQPDKISPRTCPPEKPSGSIQVKEVWQCPSAKWSNPVEISNTCTCNVPTPSTRTIPAGHCAAGYTGSITQDQIFVSDDNTCGWVNQGPATNTCSCDPTAAIYFYRNPSCDAWEHVTQQEYVKRVYDGPNCTLGTETVVTEGVCTPNKYYWRIIQSSGLADNPEGEPVNKSCEWDDFHTGKTIVCYTPSGTKASLYKCQCKP